MSDDVTTVTLEEADQLESKTDWERIEGLTDEEIHRAVEEDPDSFLLDENWFENAVLVSQADNSEGGSASLSPVPA
jgi:hypothetical protein